MTARRGSRRCAVARRAAAALVVALAVAPGACLPASAAIAGEPLVAGVVVHLAGAPSPQLPAGAAELRGAALDLVSAILQSRGLATCDRAQTEDLVRRHLVRTGASFGDAFLADLAREARANVLVAVSLQVAGDRLAAGVRAIDTNDGTLLGIGFAEANAAPDPAQWRLAVTGALREAVPAISTGDDGPRVVVLPALAVGLGPEAAGMATAGVLAAVLADGHRRPLDPAVVAAAAAAGGCDLGRLDGRARALLRERCGVDWVVVTEIVSFGEAARAGSGPGLALAAEAGEPGGIDGGWGRADLSDFTLTLRLLDLRTGLMGPTCSVHSQGGPIHGWFGRVSAPGEPARIRAAARGTWSRFQGYLEENAS